MVLSENYMQKPRGIPYLLVKTTSVEVNISSTSPQHFRTICGLVVRVIYRYTLNIYLHIGYIRTPWTENPFLSKQYNYERWRLFTWLMYNMMGFYRFLWVSCRFPTFFSHRTDSAIEHRFLHSAEEKFSFICSTTAVQATAGPSATQDLIPKVREE